MELTRLKKKLTTAIRGHKLLKDKRDELMKRFLDLVKENKMLREIVEEGIKQSNKNFLLARAQMQSEVLEASLMAPKQDVLINVEKKNIMSIEVPLFTSKTRTPDPNDIYSYGFAFTSFGLDSAVKSLSEVFPSMLRLAQCEKTCMVLASEIEKTRRRVNALEYIVIPQTREGIKYITMKLDENERSTQVRLMKVKDMMIEKIYS